VCQKKLIRIKFRRTSVHIHFGVGIDHLVPKSAKREIRSLGDKDELGSGGFVYDASVDWPQATQDSEQRGFTAAVRANDEQVLLGGPLGGTRDEK